MPTAAEYGVVDVRAILEGPFGLSGTTKLTRRGWQLRIECPNPKHPDTHPSCDVSLDNGYWHCFSCAVGGDLVKLGCLVLGRSASSVEELLRPGNADMLRESVRARLAGRTVRSEPLVRAAELPDYEPLAMHRDLRRRGFTEATLARWELGWAPEVELEGGRGKFTVRNMICIPLKDADGTLRAWCYRSTSDSPEWQKRYYYSTSVSDLWFGLQHHNPRATRHITVVEGALDAMWLDQNHFPALGLLGASMIGEAKIRSVLPSYSAVWLFPDRDDAGVLWLGEVIALVGGRMPVYVCQYRPWMRNKNGSGERATDPEQLIPLDLEIAHLTAPLAMSLRLKTSTNHSPSI